MKNETLHNERRRSRLVLVPCPYQGHITPMLQLGSILHSRGFSVTISHAVFNSPDPKTRSTCFSFLPIPDGLSDSDISPGDITHILSTINENCKLSFLRLMESQDQDQIVCIIFDEHMYFAEEVATKLNLPTIILRTTSSATFLARFAVLRLQAQGYIPFQGIY